MSGVGSSRTDAVAWSFPSCWAPPPWGAPGTEQPSKAHYLSHDISSQQEENSCKIRRVSEEEQIATGESEGHNGAEIDRVVEEVASGSDGNCAGQVQCAVAEVQCAADASRLTQVQVLTSVTDPVSSDMSAVPAGGQCQPAASDHLPSQTDVDGAERTAQENEASKSDEKSGPVEDSVEPLVVKAGGDQEMKECETKNVPVDPASSKPCLTRCTRSRLVHQRNSFSYKRMLPFLMENDISSHEGVRAKLQTVPEEKQLSSHESDVIPAGDHHLSTLKDSAKAAYGAELERIVEEIASSPYENCLVKGAQLQYAVAEVSQGGSTAEMEKVTSEVVLSLDKDELASDGDGLLPSESNVPEAERMVVEEKDTDSDENSVPSDRDLQSAVSEVSPQEGDTEKEATLKSALASDGDEARRLTSDKDEFLVKDQPQLCQSSESGCSNVGFGSPTNTVTMDSGADRQGAQERQDSVASPDTLLLGVRTICKPSDPCASVSAEEVSGSLTQAESGLSKLGPLRPCGSPSLEKRCLSPKLSPVSGGFSDVSCLKKRVLSPKKLSPKKGILKRPANGCKGICMCLDCSVFRLCADRAFEFSRKQMEEADDIIGNLLEEVASLRSLAVKSSGQQEQIEEACQRASRAEEVAKERQRQMQVELNAHCKFLVQG